MAKTFLDAVNDVLRRVSVISGDAGALTTFVDSARQPDIDHAKALLNDVVQELYSISPDSINNQSSMDEIVLIQDQREYCLPPDLERINWPIIDETNGQEILEYPGGFEKMRYDQLKPSDWTGLPRKAIINPDTGELRMDTSPTAGDLPATYTLYYDRRLFLEITTDTFPASDTVVDGMVAAAAELWELTKQNDRNSALFQPALGRAMRHMRQAPPRSSWYPR